MKSFRLLSCLTPASLPINSHCFVPHFLYPVLRKITFFNDLLSRLGIFHTPFRFFVT